MTFQNIFSSMADFRAVVSVLPCSPTNKGKKNLCGCAEKANRQWAFVAFWLSSYVNIKTAAAFANWLAPKKDALFSLIYFFGSFCIYYIPHNYTIPQAMPHAIPQTHSAFYPHRSYINELRSLFCVCYIRDLTIRQQRRPWKSHWKIDLASFQTISRFSQVALSLKRKEIRL